MSVPRFSPEPVALVSVRIQANTLKDLVADMRGSKVDVFVILGEIRLTTLPADFGFADFSRSGSVSCAFITGYIRDETAELCHWHVDAAHYIGVLGRCAGLRRHRKRRPAVDRSPL